MATPTTLPSTFVAGNVLTAAQMNNLRGAFRVLQVVEANKLDVFSTASSSYVDVTGWTATITPSATTSKILVIYSASTSGGTYTGFQIVRGSTAIGNGTASGSRVAANKAYYDAAASGGESIYGSFLDSPSTTSATTYKMQVKNHTTNTLYVGATFTNVDNAACYSTLTNITLMEISA